MNRHILYWMALAAMLWVGCTKEDKEEDIRPIITMTTRDFEVTISLEGNVSGPDWTIDWGDAETTTIKPGQASFRYLFSHSYYSVFVHTITIKGSSITGLWSNGNQLTSLDVSANTLLTNLRCSNNQLTTLGVSANTALQHLYCGNNQLTSLDVSVNTVLQHLYC